MCIQIKLVIAKLFIFSPKYMEQGYDDEDSLFISAVHFSIISVTFIYSDIVCMKDANFSITSSSKVSFQKAIISYTF